MVSVKDDAIFNVLTDLGYTDIELLSDFTTPLEKIEEIEKIGNEGGIVIYIDGKYVAWKKVIKHDS